MTDILAELEKPGRDPRGEFETATFAEGVEALADLAPDMILEGVVSNVTNFGAFVDIGVHQDGLVHISQMSHSFVKDPNEVVRAGQVVRVKVMSIDLDRRRIALSMRLDDESREFVPAGGARDSKPRRDRRDAELPTGPPPTTPNAFARAFAKLEAKEQSASGSDGPEGERGSSPST